MAMHLFSEPTQCAECGTLVSDPTADRCPNCGKLLRERRTPSRLAGVDKRYGGLRVTLSLLRFAGIATALIGVLVFFTAGEGEGLTQVGRVLVLLGGMLVAVIMLAIAGLFNVVMDLEENTRAGFGIQRKLLEHLRGRDSEPELTPTDRAGTPAA